MSQFLLSFEQISTTLRFAELDPAPGAPLEGVEGALLRPGDDGFRQLAGHALMLPDNGSWRINRAFALALSIAAAPDEAVWIETDRGDQRLTLARRESLAAECTVRPDGIIRLEFPQVWTLLDQVITEAFSGDGGGSAKIPFEFRGRADEALLLSLIVEAALHEPCRLDTLQALVDGALVTPAQTLPFVQLGCGDALLDLISKDSSVSACALSLITSGLINADNGVLRPTESVAAALKNNGETADLSIRRRIFTPTGYATIGLSAVRSGDVTVACTSELGDHGEVKLHWRTVTRGELADKARKILGLK